MEDKSKVLVEMQEALEETRALNLLSDIEKTIDEQVNTLLKLHGGSCVAVSVEDGVLSVRLSGGCVGCPSSKITLMRLIQPIIQNAHPEISDVILVV